MKITLAKEGGQGRGEAVTMKQISAEEGMKKVEELDRKVEDWKKTREQEMLKEIERLNQQLMDLGGENSKLEAEVKSLEAKLEDAVAIGNIGNEIEHLIDRKLAKMTPGGPVPSNGTEVEQELTLENVTTKIKVEKAPPRTLPKVSDDTPEGEIVELIRQGKLDEPKREREIKEMMADGADGPTIIGPLQKLTKDRVLLRIQQDKTHVAYKKHPKVTVEKA